jgi:TRAP-type C4-dicarboxylate transport system permease small subunit
MKDRIEVRLMKIMDRFGSIVNLLVKIQMAAGFLGVVLIGIIIPVQVILRYVFNAPLIWPEDVGIGLMIWIAFIGAAVLYQKGQHISVEIFLNYLSERVITGVMLAIDIAIGVVTAFIIIYSVDLCKLQLMTMQVGVGIPRAYFYAIPLLFNMSILFIYNVHSVLRRIISIVHS